LRDLLVDESEERSLLVASHSHLFLNRHDFAHNYLVRAEGEVVSATPVGNDQVMHELVFRLLGNSTTDLFFPGNYLVVEGASDQVISERVLQLLGHPPGSVKVLAAQGIGRAQRMIQGVIDSLTPFVVHDSPYAGTVVALVDAPREQDVEKVGSIREQLGERLYVLPQSSLEEYLPDELYSKAGRDKDQDLEQIARLREQGDAAAVHRFKRTVSEQIASVLTEEDLPSIGEIRDAVAAAADLAS
jgi:hypothetical protein